jgi:hypothetical protein
VSETHRSAAQHAEEQHLRSLLDLPGLAGPPLMRRKSQSSSNTSDSTEPTGMLRLDEIEIIGSA